MGQDSRSFEELVAEGAAVPTEGWDFSWFEGRATEARPSWGYAKSLGRRLAGAGSALDIQTGGGEVLHFALAGRAPMEPDAGESMVEFLARRLCEEPDDIRQSRPDVPGELGELITALLQADPGVRPSAAGCRRGLVTLRRARRDASRPLTSQAEPRQDSLLLLPAVLVGATLLGLLGMWGVISSYSSEMWS